MEDPPPQQRLRCAVQLYEWGRRGAASLVARLADQQDPDPYAELRMGTHPSGPSTLLDDDHGDGELLTGSRGTLLLAMQVLSVAKALSIQARPDKKLTEALHALRPSVYKDGNHKPEMAIAITEFRALFGFAGIQELRDVLRTVPEIEVLIGHEHAAKLMSFKECDDVGNEEVIKSSLQSAFAKLMAASQDMSFKECDDVGNEEVIKSSLQSAFAKLMAASQDMVSEALSKLISRLNIESKIRTLTDKEQLILSLERLSRGCSCSGITFL